MFTFFSANVEREKKNLFGDCHRRRYVTDRPPRYVPNVFRPFSSPAPTYTHSLQSVPFRVPKIYTHREASRPFHLAHSLTAPSRRFLAALTCTKSRVRLAHTTPGPAVSHVSSFDGYIRFAHDDGCGVTRWSRDDTIRLLLSNL